MLPTYYIHLYNILYSNTSSPFVVVLSGSMEPTFYRGDILMLSNRNCVYEVGDILVFEAADKEIPIVHRILEIAQDSFGKKHYLTKGDNNQHSDTSLYRSGKRWLPHERTLGKIVGCIPYLGYLTLFLTEHLVLKCLLITFVVYTTFIDV
uniref:Signal peptidase complex catalytic subunit SEC11 n=2 Tax=Lygus hesperus TaxID=30085 RepID=A0A0A9XIU4_LYGHE